MLSLLSIDVAVEVFACDYFCGQLAPENRHLGIILLKDGLAGVAAYPGGSFLPFDFIEGVGTFGREEMFDFQSPRPAGV
jgi:hypothetical protein